MALFLITVARDAPHKLPVDCPVCGTTYVAKYKAKIHMMQKHKMNEDKAMKKLSEDEVCKYLLSSSSQV
jgi:hypothetical protein